MHVDPTFSQVFFDDDVVYSVLAALKNATKSWLRSSLCNEAVLLNEVSDSLLEIGSSECRSKAYPDLEVSASRTILDRKGEENRDKFGADLAVTLSLVEGGKLIKQRTALLQLKIGERTGSTVAYRLDVRQVYTVGHNKDSAGRWFMAVCDSTSGIWMFGSERQIGAKLTSDQLGKVPFPNQADRKQTLPVGDDWSSISEWTLDWLAGGIGLDSDLTDAHRLEAVLAAIRAAESAKRSPRITGQEFEDQFESYSMLLPRIHIEYTASVKRGSPKGD